MLNLCIEALKFYSRQQQRPGNLLNLNNINLQFTKWCCNNYIFTFYVSINCFHENFLKIFVLHKPKGFWRIGHDVIMFRHDDIVNKMVPNFLVLFTYEIWWPLSSYFIRVWPEKFNSSRVHLKCGEPAITPKFTPRCQIDKY